MAYATLCQRKTRAGKTVYYVQWTEAGKVRTQTIGPHRRKAREALGVKLEALRHQAGRQAGRYRLSDLKAAVSAWMAHRAAATREKAAWAVQALTDELGDVEVRAVDRRAVMEFRAARLKTVAVPTVNRDLRHLRSVLSYAVDAGWLEANPLLRWRGLLMTEPQRQIRVVEPAEFERLLEQCTWADYGCLLTVAYYQGLRRTELVHLRWVDVDLGRATLSVVNRAETGELTKSRKNRTVPLRRAALDALTTQFNRVPKIVEAGQVRPRSAYVFAWEDGRPLVPVWVTHEFKRVADRAGVECTLHDLRRSFSTLAQRAGVDRSLVKDLGGWSCVRVVEQHYSGDISEAYRRATKLMDGAG